MSNGDKIFLSFIWIIFVIIIITFMGCNLFSDLAAKPEDLKSPRQFLFENPEISFQVNNGPIYNKHSVPNRIKLDSNNILTFYNKGEKIGEVFCKQNKTYLPGKLRYFIVGELICLKFKEMEPLTKPVKKVIKVSKSLKEKEKKNMTLSLGTWIFLIIIMVIVAKIAHKISLRTIFKPTKKAAKHVVDEWKES